MTAARTLRFRPLTREDLADVGRWLAAPHVAEWWRQDHRIEAVETEYGPVVDGTDPTEVFIIIDEGRPIGLIQRYLLDADPEWERAVPGITPAGSAGIDYLIGEEGLIGRGLGPTLIAQFVQDTWTRHPRAPAILVAVLQDNRRSWRALEKAGFDRIWAGELDSDDPSDEGLSYVYLLRQPPP